MAHEALPDVPFDNAPAGGAAVQHGPWRKRANLASGLSVIEAFLAKAGFARAPWLVVGFAAGIGGWFALPSAGWWTALMLACGGVAVGAMLLLREEGSFPFLRQALAFVQNGKRLRLSIQFRVDHGDRGRVSHR